MIWRAPSLPRCVRAPKILFALAIIGAVASSASADTQQAVYDPAGRLIGVIDAVNGSAQYQYDANGNILSIVRNPASTLVVVGFSPVTGPAGTVITISGTAFDTTSDTTVSFNGTAATPTTVSATQITVAVPSGATTGPITVTSPAGTVTTSNNFAISTAAVPAITSFSPSTVAPGSSITISGNNFDPVNSKVFINDRFTQITAASTTSLTANIPTLSSGAVKVETPLGTATAGDLLVDPPGTATSTALSSLRTTIGQTVTANTSGSSATTLVLFNATAGQRASALVNISGEPSGCATISVYAPDTLTLVSPGRTCATANFYAPLTLAQAGTYTLAIASSSAGSASVNLISVPPDVTASGTIGGSATQLSIAAPGQHGSITFSGTTGQTIQILFNFAHMTDCVTYSVLNPDGTSIVAPVKTCAQTTFLGSDAVLPETGTYTITFQPTLGNGTASDGTGTLTAQIFNVPADATGTATIGGSATQISITVPGQQGDITFSGTASQKVNVLFNFAHMTDCTTYSLLNPDGTTLVAPLRTCASVTFLGSPTVLPQTGTYTIHFVPSLANPSTTDGTGTLTAQLFNIPADATGTTTIGGSATQLSITAPGQHGSITFSGTTGQTISLLNNFSGMTDCVTFSLLNPNNTTLIGPFSTCASETFVGTPVALPQTGIYTITFTPHLANPAANDGTGTLSSQVFNVPAAATTALTIGGPSQSITIGTPGQQGAFTFSGTSGQKVAPVLTFAQATSCNTVSVLNPDGTTLVSAARTCASTDNLSAVTLSQTGTFTIKIVPGLGDPGSPTEGTETVTGTISLSS